MVENEKISLRQFKILVFLFSLGSTILIVPSVLTGYAHQDSWMSAVLGVLVGGGILYTYYVLGNRYPNRTLMEYSELILGKWMGKGIGFLFYLYFFLTATLVLRNVGDFITTIIMPETPIQVIHFAFLLIIMLGTGMGLEVIARAAEVFLPWVLLFVSVLLIFLVPQMKYERLLPIFESSTKAILHGSLSVLSIPYLELVVFLMIYPAIYSKLKAGKGFVLGGSFGGLIVITITILCVAVLGWDFTERHTFPSYTLAKKIHLGGFIQRIEVLVAVIWFVTIYFKLIICFYSSVVGLAQLLRLRTYRPFIVPSALVMFALAYVVYPNIIYFRDFAANTWTPLALTMGFFLPMSLLIVSFFRRPSR
ncbi:GerAB/ArcD/ProY family transporter [Paenibacillus roseipurpureus]|uniref:Endospore germination permease n=1 Tax=Paenibacillus roseopurpureus TaxID=2918901 RepID=A0AA96LN31_9BACL|nr:endospore germination permease [Paenibacillus sp. MBLB1832]WNR44146.1 endospore germination permease [Paenibacillus sp. MBLB1832]